MYGSYKVILLNGIYSGYLGRYAPSPEYIKRKYLSG